MRHAPPVLHWIHTPHIDRNFFGPLGFHLCARTCGLARARPSRGTKYKLARSGEVHPCWRGPWGVLQRVMGVLLEMRRKPSCLHPAWTGGQVRFPTTCEQCVSGVVTYFVSCSREELNISPETRFRRNFFVQPGQRFYALLL